MKNSLCENPQNSIRKSKFDFNYFEETENIASLKDLIFDTLVIGFNLRSDLFFCFMVNL